METRQNILIGARRRISPQDIMLLTADINYTKVYLSNGRKMTVATSLKILEKRFENCSEFFRTHKSYLINLSFVKSVDTCENELFIHMKNDHRVAVSRRKKTAFLKKTNLVTC
jgi:DNA-binding LytR/AlgR family response regulator